MRQITDFESVRSEDDAARAKELKKLAKKVRQRSTQTGSLSIRVLCVFIHMRHTMKDNNNNNNNNNNSNSNKLQRLRADVLLYCV